MPYSPDILFCLNMPHCDTAKTNEYLSDSILILACFV